jgi:hypothetical protein
MIVLVSEQEQLEMTLGGEAVIYYRRVPGHVQKRIEARHTKRGVIDHRAVAEEVLQYAVLGWNERVVDGDGAPVPFRKELLAYLPEDAKTEIVQRLYESDPTGALEKNSVTGSTAP